MSKKEEECKDDKNCPQGDNTPVPERLCESRRETLHKEIESQVKSIRNAVYLTGLILAIITVIFKYLPQGGA